MFLHISEAEANGWTAASSRPSGERTKREENEMNVITNKKTKGDKM